ncbi:MAG TPA: hypothetical protein VGG74_05170 [Kofleriaceae bacterium]|jgi:hypothetical protein
MDKLSLADLATVTGGQGSSCQLSGGTWTPTPPNRTLDGAGTHFSSKGACTAAVKQWSTSLMNIDNDRAD